MKQFLLYIMCAAVGYGAGWWQYGINNLDARRESIIAQFEKDAQQTLLAENSRTSTSSKQPNEERDLSKPDKKTVSSTFDTLRKLDSISTTDLASLALSPTVEKVIDIIDDMSPEELAIAINSVTGLEIKEINALEDPHSYAKNLVEIALRNKQAVPTETSARIVFGTRVDSNNSVTDPQTVFGSSPKQRIYASFTLSEEAHNRVIAKWYQVSPYKLHLMNRYSISPNKENNYIWFAPKNWKPGLYAVEIHALDSDVSLLATGSFEIIEQ